MALKGLTCCNTKIAINSTAQIQYYTNTVALHKFMRWQRQPPGSVGPVSVFPTSVLLAITFIVLCMKLSQVDCGRPRVSVIVWGIWTLCFSQILQVPIVFLIILHCCRTQGNRMASGGIIVMPELFHEDDAMTWFRCIEVCEAANKWADSRKLLRLSTLLR